LVVSTQPCFASYVSFMRDQLMVRVVDCASVSAYLDLAFAVDDICLSSVSSIIIWRHDW
jgi:hypothetical protein